MKEKDKRHTRRVRNLVILLALTTMILAVSTYAWFIGNRTVNVSPFDVEIAATEDLQLSLDGINWADDVSINQGNYASVNANNNTNWWAGAGLKPISSIGDIDNQISRLVMYEKASLTTSGGGYRLMASRVPNNVNEVDGYVAFDLFIKNSSGTEYYAENNVLNEEAIYLSTDSKVEVSTSGGVANTGIENSVRVAFAQIGRVIGTTEDPALITGITCNNVTPVEGVTGICRPAQIWEPNDRAHVQGAINYYSTACKLRTGDNLSTATFAGPCSVTNPVVNTEYFPTYAVAKVIDENDNVDVYDGSNINGYAGTIIANDTELSDATKFLYKYPTFTDEMRDETGIERDEFISLAPNSITKVRVYVYIEGQDIDNYDYASIGKAITVSFGFTKQRFTPGDIQYNDDENAPAIRPVITLNNYGSTSEINTTLQVGDTYNEAGVLSVVDTIDGILANPNDNVTILGTVDTEKAGTYIITYRIKNSRGVLGTAVRTITVTEE